MAQMGADHTGVTASCPACIAERAYKVEALLAATLGVIQLLEHDIIQINRNPIPRLALAALLKAAEEIGVLPQKVEL